MRFDSLSLSVLTNLRVSPPQGSITTKDMGTLLRALGKSPSMDELQKIFNQVGSFSFSLS
jgi:Ca2+-binding EF-hand superfamily protein